MLSLFLSLAVLAAPVEHDYSEMDIVVRESLENYLRDSGESLDPMSLEYGSLQDQGAGKFRVPTSIKITGKSGFYDCETLLERKSRSVYSDLGSICVPAAE